MRFPFVPYPVRQAIYPLGGAAVRHRPMVPIHIIGPAVLPPVDACIDSASDDTLFPESFALRLAIDLTTAPSGQVQPPGHASLPVRYARVLFLLVDGLESCEWEATIGFVAARLRWPLLGLAGFLQFFDTELRGARLETVLKPNASFPGRHVVYQPSTP